MFGKTVTSDGSPQPVRHVDGDDLRLQTYLPEIDLRESPTIPFLFLFFISFVEK